MADWNKYFKRPSWIPRWLNIPLLIFAGFIVWLLFFGFLIFIAALLNIAD